MVAVTIFTEADADFFLFIPLLHIIYKLLCRYTPQIMDPTRTYIHSFITSYILAYIYTYIHINRYEDIDTYRWKLQPRKLSLYKSAWAKYTRVQVRRVNTSLTSNTSKMMRNKTRKINTMKKILKCLHTHTHTHTDTRGSTACDNKPQTQAEAVAKTSPREGS